MKQTNSIIDRLKTLAKERPDDVLYRYIEDDSSEPQILTYSEVDREAKKIATNLLQNAKKGDRALMLYPAGLEFITAYYGCLYAGMVAVPAYPPRKNQKIIRLKAIIDDAEAAVVMITEKAAQIAKPLFEADVTLNALVWLESDSERMNEVNDVLVEEVSNSVTSDDIAFLQYTSGSTGNPKGVMVSHANLMSNMEVIYTSCGYTKDSIGVSWLPHFHDMGLMAGVVQPIYSGTPVTFMAPAYFLQKPIRWMQMVDKYKATKIAGPNFAYELCIEKISDEDLKGIDLSSLNLALNGAEPVHAATLRRFSEKFSKAGFDAKAHFPSYGMAETTLLITSGNPDEEAKILPIDIADLQNGVITVKAQSTEGTQEMVSSGHTWTDHEMLIVDPDTLATKDDSLVGEVWVRGSSITQGYWKNPEKTKEDFQAFTSDTNKGPFLRTGDLAFIHEEELYICGRAKDLLIIRGKNFYPQDIEQTVSASHEALSAGNAAAFSLDIGEREQLVIVQELQRTHMRKFNEEEVLDAIIESIALECELQVYDVLLLRPGQVLKTSSGKIQRQANKKAYLEDEYKVLGRLRKNDVQEEEKSEKSEVLTATASQNKDEVSQWLRSEISVITQTDISKIVDTKNFMVFGLDSLASVQLQDSIAEKFGIELSLVTFYDYPTIGDLVPYMKELIAKSDGKVLSKRKLPTMTSYPENRFEKFPLNNIQQAYLLGRRPDLTLGNTPCFAYTEIATPNIDFKRMEKAWNALIQRHDMLRCVMHEDIRQQVVEDVPYQVLTAVDIAHLNKEDLAIYLEEARERKLSELPDPSRLPLVSLEAYILPNGQKKVHIYVDMLVCDASSMFIILEELHYFYNLSENANEPLEPLGITFKDYLKYVEEHKEGAHFEASLKYWRNRLETLPSGPTLALQKQPVEIVKPKFKRHTFSLKKSEWTHFQNIAASLNVTPTAVLLALYGKVLATWSNDPHFCINLTHFHRLQAHKDVNRIIGDFTSLIPLEVNIPAQKKFENYLQEVQSQLLNDLEHDEIGGVQILREMRSIGRESSMPVVFTSTLGLNDFACDWLGEREFTISQTPQVWIDNQVMQKDGELIINWDCIDELFREQSLENMFKTYADLIESFLEDLSLVKVKRYSPIFERRDAVYAAYNDTGESFSDMLLPQLCMQSALEYGSREAIITSDLRLNYSQLHSAAAQIATEIEEKDQKQNAHIAVILPKGWEQVASVLACGYAGVAYLPMAIDYPKNRMEYLLEEAGITTVLSNAETLEMLGLPETIRGIDVKKSVNLDQKMPAYEVQAKAEDLAYTIFTSGSTGKPKGVMITHESVANTVVDMNKRFNVTAEDKLFGISALNFDLSVYDIYGALSVGASLVIPEEEKRKDSTDWYEWIVKENVTVWNSVPALMKLICQEAGYAQSKLPESLRLILLSGDFIPLPLVKDIEKLSSERCEIISLGGATEASIWSIYFPIASLTGKEEKVPYGYPLANQQLYILDANLDAKPYLVHGDIYIKGKGVAQGYFNDPMRTEIQFIVDPDNGEKLYKTGDIGYLNAEGYIDIVGRSDDQVKIQGYRVELGEIEQHMLELPLVKEAVVLAKENENRHNVLVAYIVTQNNEMVESKLLKMELAKHIPDYMVPLVITALDTMPLTANGKVDKKALLALDVVYEHSEEYVAPRDEVEGKLAEIFADILKVEKVSIYDNFFEMGGDSLLATQLVSRLRNEFKIELPLKILFLNTTVESLRECIRVNDTLGPIDTISRVPEAERSVLSFAQERLWFIDQLEPNSANYNLPIAVHMSGDLNLEHVEKALNTIVARHESLRTVFVNKEGSAQQHILEKVDFKVSLVDLSSSENAKEEARKIAQKEALTPFDLEKGPLFRAEILKLSQREYVLVLNMHHIISDGWSIGILFKEFDLLITGLAQEQEVSLPELRIDYVDYSLWQRKKLEEGALQNDLVYWENELTPYPAELNVSKLLNRDKVEDTQSVTTLTQTIPESVLFKLEVIRNKHNWTLNQILLAAYSALIYRYTNQGSMVIAVPNANRPTSETEEIIGFFVNTMLIKLDLGYSSTYADVINQVQEKLLGAIDHQDAPLQSIIENLRAKDNKVELDDSFQFAFNPLPMGALPNDETKPFAYEVFDIGIESAKTLLTLTLNLTEGTTDIQFTYKSSRLADEKVQTFLNHYHELLEEFCENSESLVCLSPLFNEDIIAQSSFLKEEIKEVYPLTPMQNDLYLQGKVNFDDEYLIGWHAEVEDDANLDVVKNAITHVFSQVDLINMAVTQYDDKLYQMTLKHNVKQPFIEVHLSEGMEIDAEIRKASNKAITLEDGTLVKAILVFKDEKLDSVGYMAHHAIMDGLSVLNLRFSVDKNYKKFMKEGVFIDTPIKTALNDIDALMRKYDNNKQALLWKDTLAKVEDMPLFNSVDFGKQRVDEVLLDKAMMKALTLIRKEAKVSLFALINSIYISVLYRLFNFETDVVLFEPLSGKKSLKDSSLGVYMDVRPLVVDAKWFSDELSMIDLAQHIHSYQSTQTEPISMRTQGKLLQNSEVTFSVNFIPKLNSTSHPLDKLPENEVQMTVFSGDPYTIKVTYPENIFAGVDIKEKILLFIDSLLEEKEKSITNINFLNEKEEHEQLVRFNQNTKDFDEQKCIHQSFEEQALKTPEATAVVFENTSLSYQDLNEKANQVARHLEACGLQTDELVGICVERSLEMVIGLLAILKAGGAYVPIDPKYPSDRIEYMLEDSKTNILLTTQSIEKTLPQTTSQVVSLDTLDTQTYETSNLDTQMSSSNLAYVIYTSGSTGQPKGVMVEHSGVVNLLQWYTDTIGMNEQSCTTIISSLSFDLTQKNIFSVLQNGGKLVLSQDEHFDPTKILDVIKANECTFLNCAPSSFYALVDASKESFEALQSLEYLFLGGEPINFEHINAWLAKTDTTLVNSYGPTESSDVVSFYALEDKSINTIPIGKSVENIQLYILDAKHNLVPKGVPGELCIGGAGLARGYLNQAELTDEKFIKNPFVAKSKMYKTGDLVKYLNDGNIEYLGRIDDQVKIHGFRIELGEIEQQLLQIDNIKESVVLPQTDSNGNTFLAAYVTVQGEETIDLGFVKAELSKHLPEYMVPSAMAILESIPLTPNQKVDKKSLAEVALTTSTHQEYVAPRDETEETLAKAFGEILNVAKVGIYDNFFELGGNSILSVQLVALVKASGLKMEVKHIFQAQTVAELAKHIFLENNEESIDLSVEAVLEDEIKPLDTHENYERNDVLLTGATGFVGRYLLREILETSEHDVYCVVRASSKEEGLGRIQKSLSEFKLWKASYPSRLHIVLGDLSKANLGIAQEEYALMCEKVNNIYHSATYMNHLADYAFLKEVNVGGLKELLRFASTSRNKSLEYVSTTDVLSNVSAGSIAEDASLEEQEHFMSDGYASTKYVAEEICLIAQKRGIDVNIYRLGLITGDTKTGKNDNSQWFGQLLEANMKLNALFQAQGFNIPITPVSFVSKAIVALANSTNSNKIYHITNDATLKLGEMLEMYNEGDEKLEEVSLYEFIQRLKRYNQEYEALAITTFLMKYLDMSEEELAILQQADVKQKVIKTEKTLETLSHLDISFPVIDSTLVKKYFNASVR